MKKYKIGTMSPEDLAEKTGFEAFHTVTAESPEKAVQIVREKFPDRVIVPQHVFTAEEYRDFVYSQF